MKGSLHCRAPEVEQNSSQAVAEQARLAWARLFANGNEVRTAYWLVGGIYGLFCLIECLRNSIYSKKVKKSDPFLLISCLQLLEGCSKGSPEPSPLQTKQAQLPQPQDNSPCPKIMRITKLSCPPESQGPLSCGLMALPWWVLQTLLLFTKRRSPVGKQRLRDVLTSQQQTETPIL